MTSTTTSTLTTRGRWHRRHRRTVTIPEPSLSASLAALHRSTDRYRADRYRDTVVPGPTLLTRGDR